LPNTLWQKRAAAVLSAGFGNVSALADQNIIKNEEILHNGSGFCTMMTVLRPSSLSRANFGRGDQKW